MTTPDPLDPFEINDWFAAASTGNVAVLSKLAHHIPIDLLNSEGKNALQVACGETSNPKAVQWLIDRGQDPNVPSVHGLTALMIAASANRVDIMRCLLANGANIHAQNPYGETAMVQAAAQGAMEACACLLTFPNTLGHASNALTTALHRALRYPAMVDFLLVHGANPDQSDEQGFTPFLRAIIDLQVTPFVLSNLARHSSRLNTPDNTGHTLLMHAIDVDTSRVHDLLAAGADLEARHAKTGTTPLGLAVQGAKREVAQLLVDRGANIQAKDYLQRNILHLALLAKVIAGAGGPSKTDRLCLIQWTLGVGADHNAITLDNGTPLLLAIQGEYSTITHQLLDLGADVNAADNAGRTPLLLAAQLNNQPLVERLVALGADLNATNQDGQTPVDLATGPCQMFLKTTLDQRTLLETTSPAKQVLASRRL